MGSRKDRLTVFSWRLPLNVVLAGLFFTVIACSQDSSGWRTSGTSLSVGAQALEVSEGRDTATVVSTAQYLFYPFGVMRDSTQLVKRLYDKMPPQAVGTTLLGKKRLYTIQCGRDSIRFIEASEEGDDAHALQLVDGRLRDPGYECEGGIQIGCSIHSVLKMLQVELSPSALEKIKVLVLESGLAGISHSYVFREGRLVQIIFLSDFVLYD